MKFEPSEMRDAVRDTRWYPLLLLPARRLQLIRWQRQGRTGATPHLWKRRVLNVYAKRFHLRTLVETGTYMGEMAAAMRRRFDDIYSIELGDELYIRAAARFSRASNVHILHGDSAVVLQDLVPRLTTPSLFWLDAHYSAGVTARGESETPVVAEIQRVLSSSLDHVIVVDDAELFDGTRDYPTLKQVGEIVETLRPTWMVTVRENLIRIHPSTQIPD